MRTNKKLPLKSDKTQTIRGHKRGVVGYSRKTALLEEAITQMNAGKYGRSSAALKELLALDPQNMEARRLFATLHLRLGSLIPARQAFDSLISEAFQRQDYWLAESLLREYLAAGPRYVPFLEKLRALYQEKGDISGAVAEYGKAVDILIEDPDPDNPYHASQLYAKIRELAPAGPRAFRLASFFDAQTGELLARQSNDSGQSAVDPSLDMFEGIPGIHEDLEPMDGGRPTLDDELVPSDPPIRVQTASSTSEVRSYVLEEARTHERESPSSGVQMDNFPGQVNLGGSHPFDVPSVPAAETSETERASDTLSISGPAAVQETADATPSGQVEEIPSLACLDRAPSIAGSIEKEDRQPFQQPFETHSKEVVTEPPPDARASSNPESVSANEISEPWKQPGFSWESVFNSAWKFGSDHSANVSPSEVAKTNVEEAPPPEAAASALLEQASENQAVEIPEREAATLLGGQTSTGSPITPMSWGEVQESAISIPHLIEETIEVSVHERQPREMVLVEARAPVPEPVPQQVPEQEEWGKAADSIRFIEPPPPSPIAHVPPSTSDRQEVSRSMSVAAAAVDVLFESSRNVGASETREPIAESKPSRKTSSTLSRALSAIAGFVGSCFLTTRALVMTCAGLMMLSGTLIVLGVGAIGLTWFIMEESPSPTFQSLTTTPQRTLSDFKENGYFLLLGIDASDGHDPMQAGYDRKLETYDGNSASACFGGSESRTIGEAHASANLMHGWVRSSDPIGEFRSHQETINGWGNRHQTALNRYGQWQKLPFEDWGYGHSADPPCTAMAFVHRLHVADGFLQGTDLGVDRLEMDMEAWRIVLGQARTLAVKMLALRAINDDIAVASGLLVRSDFDGKYLGRITKFLRPFGQTELSLRWPMQNELVSASKAYENQLRAARAEEQPMYRMVASALPLPVQRRLNDYADYYDASYKAAGEGRYGSLPKRRNYIHFPASGLMDYLTNPIENIVGLEPLASWDLYNGFVVDTDAHLRLAGLQAWLRRGPPEGDLLTRIAKAGQGLYDPYTGLPMLVNMKKGALYSVGHDGKDQDADPQSDVVVKIPAAQMSSSPAKPSVFSR